MWYWNYNTCTLHIQVLEHKSNMSNKTWLGISMVAAVSVFNALVHFNHSPRLSCQNILSGIAGTPPLWRQTLASSWLPSEAGLVYSWTASLNCASGSKWKRNQFYIYKPMKPKNITHMPYIGIYLSKIGFTFKMSSSVALQVVSMKYWRLSLILLFFCFFLNSSKMNTKKTENVKSRRATPHKEHTFISSDILEKTTNRTFNTFLNNEHLRGHWPTADLILLSLTVALLLPGPRRPCSRFTCLVTPCRFVLTSSITLAELGVCCFLLWTLLLSKEVNKRMQN